ncbi:MAG: phage baseplate assembly protein V [Sphingomonadales bacterium]
MDPDMLAGDIARLGTIASVDLAAARCTVRIGDAISGPLPWHARACGPLRVWAPPAEGEQAMIICPDGQLAGAVVVPGIFSTANPAPANDAAFGLYWGDGAVFRFDPASGAANITLGAGGTLAITAPGGVTVDAPDGITLNADVQINGDLAITGSVTANGYVIGQGKSLAGHRHTGVQAGAAVSGAPQ